MRVGDERFLATAINVFINRSNEAKTDGLTAVRSGASVKGHGRASISLSSALLFVYNRNFIDPVTHPFTRITDATGEIETALCPADRHWMINLRCEW